MSEVDRLAVLAHEVRSPVAALVAIAGAYPDADDERRRRLRELAMAALDSIARLLVETSASAVTLVRLDAALLARDAAEAAALGGHRVVAAADDGLFVDGDPQRLRQALDNLIANAIGHAPAGEVVSVSGSLDGPLVVIAVSDAGEGIAEEDLARVFEPGVRLTTSRPGSGLGLSVVRAVAREHGGEVEVESSPGRGSTFRLVLPGASGAR